MINTLYVLDK